MDDRVLLRAVRLVLFDLAGTTVSDGQAGGSLVVNTLRETLQEAGVMLDADSITMHRGKDKRDTIRELLHEEHPTRIVPEDQVNLLLSRFMQRLEEQISEFTEIPGASRTFGYLKQHGIRVGLGSGFSQDLVDRIVGRLGWKQQGLVEYAMSTEALGAGRPDPRMIHDAMARFALDDARQVLKVGDTVADIEEGRNAGAWTAAVLTGTQPREALETAGPDFVLSSVAELPSLFDGAELR
jgi:phosphonatase-like hydrolase